MNCPKCAQLSSDPVECSHCGVIFAKLNRGPRPADKKPKASIPWLTPVIIVLFGTGVSGLMFLSDLQDAIDKIQAMGGLSESRPPVAVPVPAVADLAIEGVEDTAQFGTEPAHERPLPHVESYSTWNEGAEGFRNAVEEQRADDAALLVYVHTDWCPACKDFEAETLPKLDDALSPVIKVTINPEDGRADRAISDKLGVRSYPSLLFFASSTSRHQKLPRTGVAGMSKDIKRRMIRARHQTAFKALKDERFDDAIDAADRALALDEADRGGQVYHLRGLAFFKLDERDEALRDFRLACASGHQADCRFMPKKP